MMNKTGMVGMGRIENGVMTFVDATGKGFAKKVSRPVVEETVVEKKQEVDVPAFMKSRVRNTPVAKEIVVEEPKSNVIQFPTLLKAPVKRTLRNDMKKVWNYLWDLEEEK